MLGKAPTVAADMVIIDLEDAVAPSEKDTARALVADTVASSDWGDRTVAVRVNDWTSPWTVADVSAVVGERLDVVVLPKAEDAAMVRALDLVLAQVEHTAGVPVGSTHIDAQIESVDGVGNLHEICRASPRLRAVTLGPLDLAASLGMAATAAHGRRRLDSICSDLVVAARSAGIEAVDGPYVEIRDLDGLRSDAAWAAEMGFDGKWVLHPDQIDIVNEVFTPSADEVARARAILDAYEAAGSGGTGAILIDGEMVDEATCRIARRVIERSRNTGEMNR